MRKTAVYLEWWDIEVYAGASLTLRQFVLGRLLLKIRGGMTDSAFEQGMGRAHVFELPKPNTVPPTMALVSGVVVCDGLVRVYLYLMG